MTSFIEPHNARTDEQKSVMTDILQANECPFCEENLTKYHKKPILRRGVHWLVTENQWPYQGSKIHLLIILLTHEVDVMSLPVGAGEELLDHLRWARGVYDMVGGAIVMRYGNPTFSGATVCHLHAQIIMPSDGQNVCVFVGGKAKPTK
jgi:hypothetical protein